MPKKTSKEVLILQHVANEGTGTIRNYLDAQKISYRFTRLYDDGDLPKVLDEVRSVIVMGGPMNVYQEDKYPFLKEENIFIKNLIEKKPPYLGVCLGSQLLAKSLGARVMKAKAPEIGWGSVQLSKNAAKDPLFLEFKTSELKVLQWHGIRLNFRGARYIWLRVVWCRTRPFATGTNSMAFSSMWKSIG